MNISVIIPTYNRASTIVRAIDSVLQQTHAPIEIIVIDDGSSDNTREILAAYGLNIRYLYQDNRGVSSARNTGIAASCGDWIALFDSDDAWAPSKLMRQCEALRQHPGIPLCHTNEIWYRQGTRVNPMNKHQKHDGAIFSHCLPLCCISPSSAVISREWLHAAGGFDESLPACEDYDLWLRLCATHPVKLVDAPLTIKYGGHADQLSRAYWGMDRFRVQALIKLLCQHPLSAEQQQQTLTTLSQKMSVLKKGAIKHGNSTLLDQLKAYESRLDRRLPPVSIR